MSFAKKGGIAMTLIRISDLKLSLKGEKRDLVNRLINCYNYTHNVLM